MELFKRARETAAAIAREGLFTKPEQERIDALWCLTALPRAEFDATYGEMLVRFWRCAKEGRGVEWIVLRDQALACAIAALKVRQARVVPRSAPVEDAARLAEVMSFALTACVLAERFGQVVGRVAGPGWHPLSGDVPAAAELVDVEAPRAFGALLLPRLVGRAGDEWLGAQPEALREVAAYFGEGGSELREIGHDAQARIGLPVAEPTPDESSAEDASIRERKPNSETTAGSPEGNTAPAREERGGSEAPERYNGGSDIGDGREGWRWINWARAGLCDGGGVVANAADGWLHNIGGDAYCIEPDCFEVFAASESARVKTVRNRVVRLDRHRAKRRAWGKQDAFRAQLADGRRVSGMIFPGELFWDEAAPAESAAALVEPQP
ncbi:MAG: hypothetical protein F4X99_16365 [Gammaproteobacteria bacterium]|nr:hypothetical protein [Gammaproteobacteria bacterium]